MLSKGDWRPIETAPRDGTLVKIRADTAPNFEHLMGWDRHRAHWVGRWPGLMGWSKIAWDHDAHPPTHWKPLEPPDAV